jgi:hypothetical protein
MPIRATMMLADAAQSLDGKLYIMGAGWTNTTLGSISAVAMIIHVSWDLANTEHEWRLELLTEDGAPVLAPVPGEGTQPIALGGGFEVGRPPGARPGMDLPITIGVQLGPLAVEPGAYVWRLLIDGSPPDDTARLPFVVHPRAAETGGQAAPSSS